MPVVFNPLFRATPTVSISSFSDWSVHNALANITFTGISLGSGATNSSVQLDLSGLSSGTQGTYAHLRCFNGSIFNTASSLSFSAEL